MTDWGMWIGLVGQLIQAIAKAVDEPVDKVRARLLADPRITSMDADLAADAIEGSLPTDGEAPSSDGAG